MRILFAGTPEFAAVSLRALLASRHSVVGVLTQPDRPAGRGRKPQPSAVKQVALSAGIALRQPETLRDSVVVADLAQFEADLMVVVAYGLLLPEPVLGLPRLGCLNVHGSLLPRWRGAAPIQRAILAGDQQSGVTIMQMERGLDTGPMLLRRSCPIQADDSSASLSQRLADLGAETLLAALDLLESGDARFEPQDEASANYAAKIGKQEAEIDWRNPATSIDRQVRAFNPAPIAFTHLDEIRLNVWAGRPLEHSADALPGTLLGHSEQGLEVACGQGRYAITQLQWPGGRPLASGEIWNARRQQLAAGRQLRLPLSS
ncbi:MAG TPA: methionyl-tRNA formyltransferase [Pseudomonadales bacterium]|nr:methionyl-tRNA formyltransferase [Pseudomonadales bacterium]HMW15760.1 methionyl-tRNA formyltransferase [Pseudomonadales bacterium]HMW82357.1 methionyl-tRNA formyltransferase [Pseudomonadales bacterium]HMY95973.1 methionyl-tRNA formyltransferase [Pseudomonadales bacterium]HMZ71776.1 methionyl-tRNA formyltransferase [Pseudomonadales bacterium]